MHGFRGGVPIIERARDRNRSGGWMIEFKSNRLELQADISGTVVVMFMFLG
jgi:hypothetical protein